MDLKKHLRFIKITIKIRIKTLMKNKNIAKLNQIL